MANNYAILEGLLFIAGDDGLDIEQVASSLMVKKNDAVKIIDEYKKQLEADIRGLSLMSVGSKYKLSTKKEYKEYYSKVIEETKANKLSAAALETLSIIAYKEPITRIGIEDIRGIGSETMVKTLLAKALIKEVGREETPGRPILYAVTDEFMDYMNLHSLSDLPDIESFSTESDEENIFDTKFTEES